MTDFSAHLGQLAAARRPALPRADLSAGLGLAAGSVKSAANPFRQNLDQLLRGGWAATKGFLGRTLNRDLPHTPILQNAVSPAVGGALAGAGRAVGRAVRGAPATAASAVAGLAPVAARARGGGAALARHPWLTGAGAVGAYDLGRAGYEGLRGDPLERGAPESAYRGHLGEWNQQTGGLRRQIEQAVGGGDSDQATRLQAQLSEGRVGGSGAAEGLLRRVGHFALPDLVDAPRPDAAYHQQRMQAAQGRLQTEYDTAMGRHAGRPDADRAALRQLQVQLQGGALPPTQRALLERQQTMLQARLDRPAAGESPEAAALAARARGAGMSLTPFRRQGPPQASGLPAGYLPPGYGWGLAPGAPFHGGAGAGAGPARDQHMPDWLAPQGNGGYPGDLTR